MEIKSPPATREEPVIDIDFGFVGGAVKGFTLFESKGDFIEDGDEFCVLNIHDEGGEEFINVYYHSIAWRSIRHRTLTIPIDGPVIDRTGSIAQPDLSGSSGSESADSLAPTPEA